jgi:hypothetical protein
LFGPEIIKEAERQVQVVRENLKVAQLRQKSYADTRQQELTFEEEDCVSESVTYQRFAQILGQREVVTSLHWPIQDLGMERRRSLPTRATCATVRRAQCVPHMTVQEVFAGTGGTVATGGVGCTI